MAQGGFRLDWRDGPKDAITASGDLYEGSSGQPTTVAIFTPPFSQALVGDAAFRGRNVLARWTRTFASAGELVTQAYYDETNRHEPAYGEDRNTTDLDVRHRFRWGGRHDAVWGVNYRHSRGRFVGVPSLQIVPAERGDDIAGLFANDEARFVGDRLRLTLGTKLEWNDYSGWNVQPSGRAAWVSGAHVFWGSVTRALRTSSRLERDLILYSALSPAQPLFAKAIGSPDFEPESVLAYEAGYKLQASRLILRASAFHNAYRDLADNQPGPPFREPGVPPEPDRTVIPVRITNGPGGTAKAAGNSAGTRPGRPRTRSSMTQSVWTHATRRPSRLTSHRRRDHTRRKPVTAVATCTTWPSVSGSRIASSTARTTHPSSRDAYHSRVYPFCSESIQATSWA
jgi:iron complex outermembrane receptor protein